MRVEIVGRLVEKERVGIGAQQFEKARLHPFPARNRAQRTLRKEQSVVKLHFAQDAVMRINVLVREILAQRFVIFFFGQKLREIGKLAFSFEHARIRGVTQNALFAAQHFDERRFAVALLADHGDLIAPFEHERKIFDQNPAVFLQGNG